MSATCGLLAFLIAPLSSLSAQPLFEVRLATAGRALMPVVISPKASPDIRAAAEEFADYLGRISGAPFRVEEGDSAPGIVVGLVSSFADLRFAVDFELGSVSRDQYLLRTTDSGLYLLGTTPAAVQCALWDFLNRQGYRQFFLTDTWEVVPHRPQLTSAIDVVEQPDFVTRQAPRGAPWSDRELWARWQKRNRMNSSFSLSTGHAYGGIVRRNQQAFDEHPEYFALVGAGRPSGKNECQILCQQFATAAGRRR
ncbi:MAG: hypothetical protein KDA72_05935 [Planctomycetales bacterium]|nr:hypothetical protein [Planctomycetales bacterium]